MVISRYIMLCLALIFFCNSSTRAQYSSLKQQNLRGDIFFGLGPALSKQDLTFNLGAEIQAKFGLLQFRVNGIHEGIRILKDEEPLEFSVDVSFLYGWRILLNDSDSKNKLSLSILGGLGEARIIRKGELISAGSGFGPRQFDKIEHREIGFSYEVSVSSRENNLGAKIAIVGNINKFESYSGLTAGFILKLY